MTQFCNNAVHYCTIIRIQLLIIRCHKAPLLYLLWSQIIRVVLPTRVEHQHLCFYSCFPLSKTSLVWPHPISKQWLLALQDSLWCNKAIMKIWYQQHSASAEKTQNLFGNYRNLLLVVLQVSSLKQAEVLKMWPVIIAGINSGREGWQWR